MNRPSRGLLVILKPREQQQSSSYQQQGWVLFIAKSVGSHGAFIIMEDW